MVYTYTKNKNELLVLTGAVYSFVAYLTAFTLEILFIIDLAKRNNLGFLLLTSTSATTATTLSSSPSPYQTAAPTTANYHDDGQGQQTISAFEQAKLALESMQTHVTVSCLAVSVLYFVIFVASLVLITALILRSTFFLLIWMCSMATLYLPEFGLIIYVSIYGWGIDTRNGQTELLFYLLRAALNVIFIYRAHKLFKDWSYEKNFFMFKSGNRFTGYDSPYFIGDSLTTTINPVFSSSTLNLDRYDHIRSNFNSSPASNSIIFPEYHYPAPNNNKSRLNSSRAGQDGTRADANITNSAVSSGAVPKFRATYGRDSIPGGKKGFYLVGDDNSAENMRDYGNQSMRLGRAQMRPGSMLSINDDHDEFADYEMDLDYRTLTNQRHYKPDHEATQQEREQVARTVSRDASRSQGLGSSRSPGGLSYSTQSLDRRNLRDMDFSMPEQVILRPLGHQPFDYLQRPGSSSNLTTVNSFNTHPTMYSSSTKLATGNDFSSHDHQGYR